MFYHVFYSCLVVLLGVLAPLFRWDTIPNIPRGNRLDLRKFTLTWSDEFDGAALDQSKWGGHHWLQGNFRDGETIYRADGFWNLNLASVKNGKLHIASKYLEEGLGGKPGGWYSCGLDTSESFSQTYGYFECRAKMPKGVGLWSAFWMMNDAGMRTPDGDGRDGMEIDVMESPYYQQKGFWQSMFSKDKSLFAQQRDSTLHTLHYDGYGTNQRTEGCGRFYVYRPYATFHTYGVEWNPEEYIFYIDGIETARSSFGGVSQVPEYLLLSVEHQTAGWAGDIRKNKKQPSDFVVDYVRVYQYK